MPIGIVSSDDFEAELRSVSVPVKDRNIGQIKKPDSPGRNKGDVNVPTSLQTIIGDSAIIGGRAEAVALANAFGISPSSVSAYSNGAASTASYHEPKTDIVKVLKNTRQRIGNRARAKVLAAMREITPDKLKMTKARDLAGIAKDLSTVALNNDSSGLGGVGNKPSIVIFAPQLADESRFEVVMASNEL